MLGKRGENIFFPLVNDKVRISVSRSQTVSANRKAGPNRTTQSRSGRVSSSGFRAFTFLVHRPIGSLFASRGGAFFGSAEANMRGRTGSVIRCDSLTPAICGAVRHVASMAG